MDGIPPSEILICTNEMVVKTRIVSLRWNAHSKVKTSSKTGHEKQNPQKPKGTMNYFVFLISLYLASLLSQHKQ